MHPHIPSTATVVFVRYTQFDHGERISFPHVESRMLSWCKSGKGEVLANGELFQVKSDDYMFLPWGHSIEYRADKVDPFLLGGIHVIPDYDARHPIEYSAVHFPQDRLANCPWRRDAPMPELDRIIAGSFSWNISLGHLAEYITQRMLYFEADDNVARSLGRLLLDEIYHTLKFVGPYKQGLPSELQRILRYIMDHMGKQHGLHELAEFSGLSRATVGRLFKRYLQCTPGEWILQRRIHEAQRLLCTTRMPVAQVGAKVGITDQYYFSKLFKKACGIAPLGYRKSRSLL